MDTYGRRFLPQTSRPPLFNKKTQSTGLLFNPHLSNPEHALTSRNSDSRSKSPHRCRQHHRIRTRHHRSSTSEFSSSSFSSSDMNSSSSSSSPDRRQRRHHRRRRQSRSPALPTISIFSGDSKSSWEAFIFQFERIASRRR